jgi:hypothetical protein
MQSERKKMLQQFLEVPAVAATTKIPETLPWLGMSSAVSRCRLLLERVHNGNFPIIESVGNRNILIIKIHQNSFYLFSI